MTKEQIIGRLNDKFYISDYERFEDAYFAGLEYVGESKKYDESIMEQAFTDLSDTNDIVAEAFALGESVHQNVVEKPKTFSDILYDESLVESTTDMQSYFLKRMAGAVDDATKKKYDDAKKKQANNKQLSDNVTKLEQEFDEFENAKGIQKNNVMTKLKQSMKKLGFGDNPTTPTHTI